MWPTRPCARYIKRWASWPCEPDPPNGKRGLYMPIQLSVVGTAAAALLVAALGADGTTTLRDPGHIRRGYADLPGEIRRLGAEIG